MMVEGVLFGCRRAVVEVVAHQFDIDKIFAEHAGLRNFLPGRNNRHKNDALRAEFFTGISKALGVIARTGTYDATLQIIRGQLAHHVVSTPQFVRSHHLQILAFEPNVTVKQFGQIRISNQRSMPYHTAQAFGCRQNICRLDKRSLLNL